MGSITSTVIAAVAALAAGAALAATGVLQQRVASTRPEREQLSPRILVSLARSPMWLAGIGIAVLSYAFQAVALAFGPLALVQPLIVSELIFAIPVSVRLRGIKLRRREWAGIAAVVVGLVVGIAAAYPHGGNPLPPLTSWGIALGAVVVVAALSVGIGRQMEGPVQASLYALAGALIMALQSSLFAATIALFKQGLLPVFTSWQPYTLIPVSIGGMLLVESAYQAGPLAASMPVMDAVLPSAGIALGVGLFGEQIRTGVLNLFGTFVGLGLLFFGIVNLDRSPVVRRLERMEEKEQPDTRGRPEDELLPGDPGADESTRPEPGADERPQ